MAYDGELVKMENGRWARFQRCTICNAGHPDRDDLSLLVAVELDEHFQELLNAAEDSLELYRQKGIGVSVKLDPENQGKVRIEFEQPSVH